MLNRAALLPDGGIAHECKHVRIIDRRHDTAGQTVYDWRHYLAVLRRKPGALRNGAPFVELPEGFKLPRRRLRIREWDRRF